jgi:GNAT superfamily N-acetyltransferase
MLINDLKIKRLTRDLSADFYKVHQAGEYGNGCLCCYWWMDTTDNWEERTDKESIAQREALFAQGIEDGYLLYRNDEPVGWCQAYPRDQLPNLLNTFHFAPNPEVWCVSCFMIIPEARGYGFAHRFLAAVLDDLKSRGIKKVQAYPRSQSGLEATDLWTGPEGLYVKAGFSKVSDHPRRSIWEKEL